MNLLDEAWLPVITQNGKETMAISNIVNSYVIDVDIPRVDLKNAVYQLLISLLQTAFAPTNAKEWEQYYQTPPTTETLKQSFGAIKHAFELEGNGARFMQDYDLVMQYQNQDSAKIKKGDLKPVERLLINAPGEKAIELNTDLFIKGGQITQVSLLMSIVMLYCLQQNASSGGRSHRTSLRGGGPLVTLLQPTEVQSPLWQKLWLNVINRNVWTYSAPNFQDNSVFPWLAPTTGEDIYSNDVHPLQKLWSMPRRVYLVLEELGDNPQDDLTNNEIPPTQKKVLYFLTKNKGANYMGNWAPHPYTPYCFSPKEGEKEAFSVKPQPDSVNYRIWHILRFRSQENGLIRAGVIEHFDSLKRFIPREKLPTTTIWVCGYDMKKAKARGFYSRYMPLIDMPPNQEQLFLSQVLELQNLSNQVLKKLEEQIKVGKGSLQLLEGDFWQRSESFFFSVVVNASLHQGEVEPEVGVAWWNNIRKLVLNMYDERVLSEAYLNEEALKSRKRLEKYFDTEKQLKAFKERCLDRLEQM